MKSPNVLPDLTQWIPWRTAFIITISIDNKNDFDTLIVHDILNTLLCALSQFLLKYLALILNCLDAEVTYLQHWILKRQGIEATLPESRDQADLLRVPRLADHEGHWPRPVLQTVSSVLNPLPRIQSGTRGCGWFTFAISSTAPGQPGGNEAQTEQREYY